MFQRIGRAVLLASLAVLLPGCIEMTQTITLNPDGKGKVVQEMYLADFTSILSVIPILPGAGDKEKLFDEEEMRKQMVAGFVTKSKGVTAVKDVSVKLAKDGRMHLVSTTYFNRLEDMEVDMKEGAENDPAAAFAQMGKAFSSLGGQSTFEVAIEDGKLSIKTKKGDAGPLKLPEGPDFSTLSAKEQDEFIKKQRVLYQLMKPMFLMVLTDMKIKTTFRVPGEATEFKGFKKGGAGELTYMVDGNAMLKSMKRLATEDTATLKKILLQNPVKGANPLESLAAFGQNPEDMNPSLTVAKTSNALFDYDREVEAARAAYPELRKQLKIDPNTKLPGEK